MGIVQDNDGLLGRPDVSVTEYGAEYVNAATEAPVLEEVKEEEPADAVSSDGDDGRALQPGSDVKPARKQRKSRKTK